MIHFHIENSFSIRFPNPLTKYIFSVISIYFLKQPFAKHPYNFGSYKPKPYKSKPTKVTLSNTIPHFIK